MSEGDFDLALRGLLGEEAPVSASTVARLKEKWELLSDVWTSSVPEPDRNGAPRPSVWLRTRLLAKPLKASRGSPRFWESSCPVSYALLSSVDTVGRKNWITWPQEITLTFPR